MRTSILRADGSTLLPPVFAQAVVDDYDGAAVTACARVTWGPPAAARTLALTISACDWDRMTGGGAALPSTEQTVAVYRDDQGRLHGCSAVCTHLQCEVGFNSADRTWDCPCHGSRFDHLGNVIQGPAAKELETIEIS